MWGFQIEPAVIIFQDSGAQSVNNMNAHSFIQRVSDLQLVLHHVEGVVREVHLLYAVDNLLLCLGVNGLLPQLPQLLLKKGEGTVSKER